MNHKNNRRSEATRKKIKSVLLAMLKEQPIGRITVRALCEKTQINRSTFYNHYNSPEEVLDNVANDFLLSIQTILSDSKARFLTEKKTEVISDLMTQILDFIKENAETCLLLKSSDIGINIANMFMNDPVIQECFNESISDHYEAKEMEYLYHYVQHGGFHVVDLWLLKGCDTPSRELAQMIASFIGRF